MAWPYTQQWGRWLSERTATAGLHLLAWINRRLPYSWQMRMGRGLGLILYHVWRRRRHIANCNIARCLGISDQQQRAHMLRANFQSFGQGLVETGFAWFGDTHTLVERVHFSGHAHIESALSHGKGLILIGTHVHSLDLLGRLFTHFHPMIPTYRMMKNQAVNTRMEYARAQYFPDAIERHAVRAMVRALQRNAVLWLAADHDYGARHSVFVPFFGIPAATIPTVVRLAQITGAAVAMAVGYRTGESVDPQYQIVVSSSFADYPSGDLAADLLRMNQAIENMIRADPSQYMWQHRRFKTQPPGEAAFYDFQG